jgi:hypothetical protein
VVQYDEFVLDRHTSRFELSNRADDPLCGQVTPWIVVLPHHEDPGMMALSLFDQVVQDPEIVVIFVMQIRPSAMACVKWTGSGAPAMPTSLGSWTS